MASSGSSWFKYGCFGCLAIVAMIVILVASVAGVAALKVRSEEVADKVLTPEIPGQAAAKPESEGAAAATPHEIALPSANGVGRVVLELSGAEFKVEPAKPGESLHVKASYDQTSYRLEESLTEDDASNWTYTVRFESTSGGLMSGLKQLFGGAKPRVSVYLPLDVQMAVTLDISDGGAELDLGGLWMTSLEADCSKGGMILAFSEPTREPLEEISFRGSMGGMVLQKLGNASPHRLDVDLSMGGMDIDLRGQWRNDSDISLSQSMGGAALRLPHGVHVEGLEGRSTLGGTDEEVTLPTLRFNVSGEFEIR